MKFTRIIFAAALAALALPLSAQQGGTSNMDILRDKLKSDKKLIVADNMKLSDAEGKNFWPVYDAYQKDLEALNTRTIKMIEDYAEAYNQGRISNESARDLLSRSLAIDHDEVNLRKTYVAKMQKVLPDAKVARWLQIENKIRAAVRYDLASSIPLVE
jgi:hypothetical protein